MTLNIKGLFMRKIIYCMIAISLTFPVIAQSKRSTGLYLGGGVNMKRNYRTGNEADGYDKDNVTSFIPYAYYRSKNAAFEGFFGQYDFVANKLFSFGPAYQFFGEKYEANGVEDRKAVPMPGIFTRILLINFYFYKDVMGESDGTVTDIFIALPFTPTSSWKIIPRIGIQMYDENYVDHYYGISEKEATNSVFSKYEGKTGSKMYFTLNNDLQLSKSILAKFAYGFELYDKGVHESPTVYKRLVPTARFILLFKI